MPNTPSSIHRAGKVLTLAVACLLLLAALPVGPPRTARAQELPVPVIPPGSAYEQTNLVSDSPGLAPVLLPLLAGPWGAAMAPGGPLWVVNSRTRTAQPLRGNVAGLLPVEGLTVNIPGGQPQAVVANTTSDFNVAPTGGSPAPASFIFSIDREPVDGAGGRLAAWQPALGNTAQVVGPTSFSTFSYTGLALGSNAGGSRLYAAEFPRGIDVFDGAFALTTVSGGFLDPTIPADYFPYNIQNIGGSLYVAYAKRGAATSIMNGHGLGLVRKFDMNGVRDPAFAIDNGPTSQLNAPWGMALAPSGFGLHSGALLVGNFADRTNFGNQSGEGGRINAYNKDTGAFLGTLQNEAGLPVEIDGLRALIFDSSGVGNNRPLFFTAAPSTLSLNEAHGLVGALTPTTASATALLEFSTDEYVTFEGFHVDVTVTRSGDVTGPARVNYATFEDVPFSNTLQKNDYQIALGTLTFNTGESSKTFRLLTVNDTYFEADERIRLILSNPDGGAVGLGARSTAIVKLIASDLTLPERVTPVNDSFFFVPQHYYDFLNREPDPAGFSFWTNQIDSCGADTQCREVRRINVSAAFFLSIEFQRTGLLAYLTNKAAYGSRPLYGDFMRDLQALQRNVAFGQPGADAQLEENKVRYFQEFVFRHAFSDKYPSSLTPAQFVDALFAGFSPTHEERLAAIAEFGTATNSGDAQARARVLRRAAQHPDFARREFNAAFVTMEYFGYLRRDPDEPGFQFWLNKLNAANGNFVEAEMVKAFITSFEYRTRFGPNSN